MRAFPDPSASVERDRVGDDFEVVEVPDLDMQASESIRSSCASSSSETPEANKREESLARRRSEQKAADRKAQRQRLANAPPPTDRHSAGHQS